MADNSLGARVGNPIVMPIVTNLAPIALTTQGLGGLSSNYFQSRRVGECLHLSGRGVAISPTGSDARLIFPAGLTIGQFGGASVSAIVGHWVRNNSGNPANKRGTFIGDTGANYIRFSSDDKTTAADPFSSIPGTSILSGGEIVGMIGEVVIPIAEWAGSATVAYGAGYARGDRPGLIQRTPQTTITVTSAQGGFATSRAVAVAECDINGAWRMHFNITCSFTSAALTALGIAITGVTFPYTQAISGRWGGLAGTVIGPTAYTVGTTNSLVVESASVTANGASISGTVELSGKPTWA